MVGTFKEWQDFKMSEFHSDFGLTGEAISESKYGGRCVQFEPDPIVARTMKRMGDRSAEGMAKYGCTMEREDVTTTEWIDHAIEEQLDAAIYLERLKDDFMKLKPALERVLCTDEDEVFLHEMKRVANDDSIGSDPDGAAFQLAAKVLVEFYGIPGVDFDVEED